MTATERLKKRLDALPESQREAMAAQVLEEWEALQWDLRMTANAQAGKLNKLAKEAEEDYRAGRTLPLEFITGEVTYDRIKHLAGSLKGPGDLLSNPKYMDDFGKSSMR